MPTWLIVAVIVVVLVGVTAFLIGSLLTHIRRERRSANVRRVWGNFGLSIAFCALFLISWGAQALAEWGSYRDQQAAHGEPATAEGYLLEFGQSTLENWQSEFLQLFSFVVLAALRIHRGSAESKDGTDRIERKVDDIARRLDELDGSSARR